MKLCENSIRILLVVYIVPTLYLGREYQLDSWKLALFVCVIFFFILQLMTCMKHAMTNIAGAAGQFFVCFDGD